jgi:hypothetical protein
MKKNLENKYYIQKINELGKKVEKLEKEKLHLQIILTHKKISDLICQKNELIENFLKKTYSLIDNKKVVAKVYYLILKNVLEGKKVYVWGLAKEFFNLKRVELNKVNELWVHIRKLIRREYVNKVEVAKRRKKYELILTRKIYLDVLIKFFNEEYGNRYTPDKIFEKIKQIFPFFSQLLLSKLFLVKDCEDFISGKSEETPLSKAVKRVWILAYKFSKFVKNIPNNYFNKFVAEMKEPVLKSFFLLAKEVQLEPPKETLEKIENELAQLGLWNREIEIWLEEETKKWRKELLKTHILPELKEYRKKLDEYIKKAEKGIWDKFF